MLLIRGGFALVLVLKKVVGSRDTELPQINRRLRKLQGIFERFFRIWPVNLGDAEHQVNGFNETA